ncbi:MAG: hypothetical protein ACRD63_14735 [Pyrinomonadaceae bacterium]
MTNAHDEALKLAMYIRRNDPTQIKPVVPASAKACLNLADYHEKGHAWLVSAKPYAGGWKAKGADAFTRDGLFFPYEALEYVEEMKSYFDSMRRDIVSGYRSAADYFTYGLIADGEERKAKADHAADSLIEAIEKGIKAETSLSSCIQECKK